MQRSVAPSSFVCAVIASLESPTRSKQVQRKTNVHSTRIQRRTNVNRTQFRHFEARASAPYRSLHCLETCSILMVGDEGFEPPTLTL